MKRLMLVLACACLLCAGVVAWSYAGSVTAESDEIPALQTQVAELDARVSALEAAAATPAPVIATSTSPGLTWTGRNNTLSARVSFTPGLFLATFSCRGTTQGTVTFYGNGVAEELIAEGERVIDLAGGTYRFEVLCDGSDWELTMKRLDV